MASSHKSPATAKSLSRKGESGATDAQRGADENSNNNDGIRETVESVVVAFILAFLFRAFEAEAFVIPTGSMAPTLYGRHKEVDCDQCGIQFAFGASDEVDKDNGLFLKHQRLQSAICPNCRYENDIEDDLPFKGDRILVNKFPYEIGEPKRWDVPVFKYPEEPQTNYIKRLVGLPGEEIQINRGDVYARTDPNGRFEIQRKEDPTKQRELQILVYDHSRPARKLLEQGYPERWQALKPIEARQGDWESDAEGWTSHADERSFEIAAERAANDIPRWIRYQHLLPTPLDWERAIDGDPINDAPRPELITDFCSYNAAGGGGFNNRILMDDVYWIGDLTLSCRVDVLDESGTLLIELVEGVRRYRCRIDVSTGEATLLYLDDSLNPREPEMVEVDRATCELKGKGSYDLSFANVDQRLRLWIDGSIVEFPGNGDYDNPGYPGPSRADLYPVGIGSVGAGLKVSDLKIHRDIYYRAERLPEDGFGRDQEYTRGTHHLRELLHDPEEWGREYEAHHQIVNFAALGEDEFFMLGDNSPRSQDSRLWPNGREAPRRHAVPRSALVGKAFLIYWPHAIPFMNDGKGFTVFNHRTNDNEKTDYPQFTVPFYPNIWRMERIR